MKKLIICLLFFAGTHVYGQYSPYSFSLGTDIAISSSIIAGATTFYILQSQTKPLTQLDIDAFSESSLSNFDKQAPTVFSERDAQRGKRIGLTGVITGFGLQGITVLAAGKHSQSFWNHAGIIGAMAIQTNLAAYYGTGIAKTTVLRPRPYVYNLQTSDERKFDTNARYSFFSRHTAITAANTFFTAHVISQYYTEASAFTYTVWGLAAIVPASVGYFRVRSGEHFPTDVIAGYAWGAACGLFIPFLHTERKEKDSQVHISVYGPQYISLSYTW